MLENNRGNSPKAVDVPSPAAATDGGFKGFNRVGREDTATEILRPQVDAGSMQRRVIMIAVAAVLLAVLGYIAYTRSHLSLMPTKDNGPSFTQPTEHVD